MKRKILSAAITAGLAAALVPIIAFGANAKGESAPVSLGLYVIAEECDMAKAALVGRDISFSCDDFARAMNLSEIESITVTKVPSPADGELRVGKNVLTGGETIRASLISSLTYSPSDARTTSASFDFSVNGSPVDITCNLYYLDKMNSCPTLNGVTENYLNVSTHENVTLYGTLPSYDPDGDEVTIEIVSYPETGILELTDKNTGEYKFTPKASFSGKDEFKYVARDKYGNYSASKTVSLKVTKLKSSLSFADMEESPAYNAALTMTEEGIMSGTSVGTEVYFYPDKAVSRAEFVVMAMNAFGMREVSNIDKTVFADDSDIKDSMRDYIGTAYELGFIKGEVDKNGKLCFYPDRALTRAEAACIVANMIDAPTPTWTPQFSDSKDIPAWAAPSIYSLNYMGILMPSDGAISPLDTLTRADTAQILSAAM